MVASTRESVNAAVIGLREKGILEMEGGRIVLLDPERLAEIGGGNECRVSSRIA